MQTGGHNHNDLQSQIDALDERIFNIEGGGEPTTPVIPPVEPPLPPDSEAPPPSLFVKAGERGDCSESDPCGSIKFAVSKAIPGDHILVAPGTYTERVEIKQSGTVSQPIWLTGTDRDRCIINGLVDGDRFWKYSLQFDAGTGRQVNHWRVRNLTLTNNAIHGILLHNANDIEFKNLVVKRANRYGVFGGGHSAGGSNHIVFEDCFVFDNGLSGQGAGFRIGERRSGSCTFWRVENTVTHSNAAIAGGHGETGTGININSNEQNLPNRTTHHIEIIRCLAYNNGSSGITTQLPANVSIIECIVFDSNKIGTRNGDGYGIRHGFNGVNNSVRDCYSFNNANAGIVFENQVNGIIESSIAYSNRRHGIFTTGTTTTSNSTAYANNSRNFRIEPPGISTNNNETNLSLPTTIALPSGDLTTYDQVMEQLRP